MSEEKKDLPVEEEDTKEIPIEKREKEPSQSPYGGKDKEQTD